MPCNKAPRSISRSAGEGAFTDEGPELASAWDRRLRWLKEIAEAAGDEADRADAADEA